MVSVLASSAVHVDHGFKLRSGQIEDYNIGICCFFSKDAGLKSKSKDLFARNQNSMLDCSNMSTRTFGFSALAIEKSNLACWSSTKRTSSSSHRM